MKQEFNILLNQLAMEDSKFDFITIDAEGNDWNILKQIDLNKVECKCLCIEYNTDFALLNKYTEYVIPFGFKEIHRNYENVIFVK